MNEINLNGKVAIVTGGGGGMGRVISLALIEKGARVAVFDIRQETVEAVVEEATELGHSESAIPLAHDVTKIDDFSGFEYEGFKWDGVSFIKEGN